MKHGTRALGGAVTWQLAEQFDSERQLIAAKPAPAEPPTVTTTHFSVSDGRYNPGTELISFSMPGAAQTPPPSHLLLYTSSLTFQVESNYRFSHPL
jgi:hypothetical protein